MWNKEDEKAKGVSIEEIESEALNEFEANQLGYEEGFVRFLPSGQVKSSLYTRL